jgi:hypothetical protein
MKLKGMATVKQLNLLRQFGVDTNRNFTKQAASDLITKLLEEKRSSNRGSRFSYPKSMPLEGTPREILGFAGELSAGLRSGFSCTHDSPDEDDYYNSYDDSDSD